MVHPLWRLLRRAGLRRERDDADGQRPATETGTRRFLALLGLLGLAYAVARRLGVDAVPSAGEVRQTAGDALPGDAHEITIREPGEADESADEADDEADADGEGGAGESPETDLPAETVEERAVDDPHEEPAEPGEMGVDEEIAEDVVDEEDESGESAAGDESGEGDDETNGDGGADR